MIPVTTFQSAMHMISHRKRIHREENHTWRLNGNCTTKHGDIQLTQRKSA